MNYRKINPVYIDNPIDKLQKHIFDNMPDISPLWECYHRAYLNPKEKFQYIPEIYYNGNYNEVLITNKATLLSFFTVSNNVEVNKFNQHSGVISLFVQCSNLHGLPYNTGLQRADSELINDFVIACNSYNGGDMQLIRTVTGIEEVYQGLDTSNITYQAMNEWFVFRMDFQGFWYAEKKC